jgi:hypothetical protein
VDRFRWGPAPVRFDPGEECESLAGPSQSRDLRGPPLAAHAPGWLGGHSHGEGHAEPGSDRRSGGCATSLVRHRTFARLSARHGPHTSKRTTRHHASTRPTSGAPEARSLGHELGCPTTHGPLRNPGARRVPFSRRYGKARASRRKPLPGSPRGQRAAGRVPKLRAGCSSHPGGRNTRERTRQGGRSCRPSCNNLGF